MEFLLVYVFLGIGGVTLLAIWYVLQQRQRAARTRRRRPAVPAGVAGPAGPAEAGGPMNLIQIWQRSPDDPIVLEIEGRRHLSLRDIELQRDRDIAVATVYRLVEQIPELARQIKQPPTTPSDLMARPPIPAGSLPSATAPELPRQDDSAFYNADNPAAAYEDEYNAPLWRRLRDSFLTPAVPPAAGKISAIPMSAGAGPMLDEINEIFQENLLQIPDAPDSSVSPAPGGGMRIIVGPHLYNTVDEIADSAVQDALRRAIKAWEKRH
jgi:hypothetical protein